MAQEFFDIQHVNEVKYGPLVVEDGKYEKQTIIAKGKIGDYDFAIINRNFNPCSYIRLDEDHPFFGTHYDDIPVYCHYGLTYSENNTNLGFEELATGFWIGWDYGHLGDYDRTDPVCRLGDHKYTEEELIQQMIFAVGQVTALDMKV